MTAEAYKQMLEGEDHPSFVNVIRKLYADAQDHLYPMTVS